MRPLWWGLAALLVSSHAPPLGHEPDTAGPSASPTHGGLHDDFAPIVRRLMARDQIPGVALGVVERGQLVFARGFGYRDITRKLPVTPDTLFGIGSCSKAFTATAIALLADEGRIALDAPVQTYLPDFTLADPVAAATLTIRDLLTHQSGLPRHDLFWYRAPFSRDELYRRLRFLELRARPRERWGYSSLMYVVAGRVVESVSGERWESFVQTRILTPLNMRRTRLSTEAVQADSDHASSYALHEGRVRAIPMLTRLGPIAPAGAVHTSVRDLARWLAFHATRSPGVLGEDLWRELHRPQVEMPRREQPEVQHAYYALGWIHQSYRGHPIVVHDGAIDGFTVHLGYLPQTGQGLIVLMNRDGATAALRALAYSAYDRLLGLEPLDWEEKLRESPSQSDDVREIATLDFPLEQVVGRYEHAAYGVITVRAHGSKLTMEFRAQRHALVYQGERRFLTRDPIAEGAPVSSVSFFRPAMGEPPRLNVQLNFEDGDPVEVFTRVSDRSLDE